MRIAVEHVTRYLYDRPVRGVVQSHRLKPAGCDSQRVLAWEVAVTEGRRGGGFRDGAGDWVQGYTVAGPVSVLTVTVRGLVETTDTHGVLRGHREAVPVVAWTAETPATRADAAIRALAAGVPPGEGPLALAHALSAAVSAAVVWTPAVTGPGTTAAQALAQGRGVCQDQAQVLIAAARSLGMPARYVCGYLVSGEGVTGEAGHAWAELWIEGLGWVGFDPANHCCPDARYVRLGAGFDATDAAPIRGIARGPGTERIEVAVAVTAAEQAQAQQ
jgi:transglutaminase-like putative cysteine protease